MVLTDSQQRQCGGCTLCCKLLPMKAGHYTPERLAEVTAAMVAKGWGTAANYAGMLREFDKPAGEPCKHQRHSKGCAVYTKRPFCCRMWSCRWLVNDDCDDLRRPDRSRVVVDLLPDFITADPHDGSEPVNIEVVQVWVDPKHPDAWRAPEMLAYLERRAREGKAALIRLGPQKAFTVFAPPLCGDGKWHERHDGKITRDHMGDALIEGLSTTRKVIMG
jgi:hypothetical protein